MLLIKNYAILVLRHLRVVGGNTRVELGLGTGGPNYRARRVGAFRDRRVGSTHCVPRFVLHFHAWHVGMARRVNAAWIWRVFLARRVDAAWTPRGFGACFWHAAWRHSTGLSLLWLIIAIFSNDFAILCALTVTFSGCDRTFKLTTAFRTSLICSVCCRRVMQFSS